MALSLIPYHVCAFTDTTFARHLRQPDPGGFTMTNGHPTLSEQTNATSDTHVGATSRSYLTSTTSAATREIALALRQRVDHLLTNLG
jgi:hypothetical protein